ISGPTKIQSRRTCGCCCWACSFVLFFFSDPPTTAIYTLSLHDALPISGSWRGAWRLPAREAWRVFFGGPRSGSHIIRGRRGFGIDRKSTRLNSSHDQSSYAVFCLKKKMVYDVHKSYVPVRATATAPTDE